MRGGIINKPIASGRWLIAAALCGVAALLLPGVAQADALRADLDGDGVRDHIVLSRSSGEVTVRVSATRRWQRLHANDPIVRFVLADIDRDGDPDLVAHTGRFGLQVWINKGRGLFTSRARHVRTHHLRFAPRHSGPAVRGIPARGDDSALNDSTRLLIVSSTPARARFVAVCPAPVAAPAHLTKCTCQRRTPRGPPLLLVS